MPAPCGNSQVMIGRWRVVPTKEPSEPGRLPSCLTGSGHFASLADDARMFRPRPMGRMNCCPTHTDSWWTALATHPLSSSVTVSVGQLPKRILGYDWTTSGGEIIQGTIVPRSSLFRPMSVRHWSHGEQRNGQEDRMCRAGRRTSLCGQAVSPYTYFLRPTLRRMRAPSVQSVFLEQLESAPHRQSKWAICLLKVSFHMQGLLKKSLSNSKLVRMDSAS